MEAVDRIIDTKELRTLVPFCAVHIRRLEKAGKFPPRVQIGDHRVGWMLSEITAWIDAKKTEREDVSQEAPSHQK